MPRKKLAPYALSWVENRMKSSQKLPWYTYQCLQKLISRSERRKQGPSIAEVVAIRVSSVT
jgi:hypothetical protein